MRVRRRMEFVITEIELFSWHYQVNDIYIGTRGGHTMVTMEFRHRTRDLGCSLYADCRGKHFGTLGICLQLAIFAQS